MAEAPTPDVDFDAFEVIRSLIKQGLKEVAIVAACTTIARALLRSPDPRLKIIGLSLLGACGAVVTGKGPLKSRIV